ncbi:ABC transporter permease [uncultured Oscillibacter sp.]|uniref:ABC transporter permease n=1 Tax=uncultured Oscillibacter sp. TaxID=876091 RepID=UPI002804E2D6|nr:ABC transporter permease [uncultured Oscillibacter sp.]
MTNAPEMLPEAALPAKRENAVLRVLKMPLLRVYLMLLLIYAVSCILSPSYLSMDYLNTLLLKSAPLGIVAVGQTLVILTGGIDMSICYNMTLAAVVMTATVQSGHPVWACVLVMLICTGVGVVNGVGITLMRIPPIIMTLAMNMILQSVCMIYTNGTPKGRAPDALNHFVNTNYLGLRGGIWIWVAVAVVVCFLLYKTSFGRIVYALGSNASVAHFSGIRKELMTTLVYALSGAMVGIASILSVGYSGMSFLSIATDFNLKSVAVVVLGGTSIMGGKGGYVGTIAGTLVLELLLAILTVVQIDQSGKDIIYGAIILGMLLLYSRKKA